LLLVTIVFQLQNFITNSTKLPKKYESTWVRCSLHFFFQEKFTEEKYFKKSNLPRLKFLLLNRRFMNLLP